MLLVHQLLLDGLGVLGQWLRAGPAQWFMVAWERQALCRDERGGEGEGHCPQAWHWRGEEGEVRGSTLQSCLHTMASSSAICAHVDYLQTALRMTVTQPWNPVSDRHGLCKVHLLLSPLLWHQGSGDRIWLISISFILNGRSFLHCWYHGAGRDGARNQHKGANSLSATVKSGGTAKRSELPCSRQGLYRNPLAQEHRKRWERPLGGDEQLRTSPGGAGGSRREEPKL